MLGHLRSCRSCRGRPRGGRVGSRAAHLVVSLGRWAPVTLMMRLVFPNLRLGARWRFNRLGPRPSVASRDPATRGILPRRRQSMSLGTGILDP